MLDSRQVSEWIAYSRLEPFGEEHYLFGMLCSVIVNILTGKKYKAEDFMPKRAESTQPSSYKKQTVEEQKQVLMSLVQQFSGDPK